MVILACLYVANSQMALDPRWREINAITCKPLEGIQVSSIERCLTFYKDMIKCGHHKFREDLQSGFLREQDVNSQYQTWLEDTKNWLENCKKQAKNN